jgi:heterotetrameric sarcosine oxidase gamma subunit
MAEARHGETTGAGDIGHPVRQGHLSINDITNRALISLQIGEDAPELLEAVTQLTHLLLPVDPGRSTRAGGLTALGWGAGHWMIACPSEQAEDWLARIDAAIGETFAMASNVGDGFCVLRLRGEAAMGVLARGTALDLYGERGEDGAVSHTRLAGVDVTVHVLEPGRRSFDLYVPRSLGDHVRKWLDETLRTGTIVTPFGNVSKAPI